MNRKKKSTEFLLEIEKQRVMIGDPINFYPIIYISSS